MAEKSTYTVRMLKRASMLNLSDAARESHMVAWGVRSSPRAMRDLPMSEYLQLRRDYTSATLPMWYRKQPDGLHHWRIVECQCDCTCGECQGLERQCGECQCAPEVLIARIPRELTAGHLIDGGDDAIRLMEVIIGHDCDDMTVSHFRTMNMVIMSEMRTGEIPLPDDTKAAT